MEQWQAELLNVNGFSSENALHLLLFFLKVYLNHPTAMRQFDCQNTLDGLADTSIICPPVDDQLLGTYFSYLIQL